MIVSVCRLSFEWIDNELWALVTTRRLSAVGKQQALRNCFHFRNIKAHKNRATKRFWFCRTTFWPKQAIHAHGFLWKASDFTQLYRSALILHDASKRKSNWEFLVENVQAGIWGYVRKFNNFRSYFEGFLESFWKNVEK